MSRYIDYGFAVEPIVDHSNDEDRAWMEYRDSPEYKTPAERDAEAETREKEDSK